MCCRSKLFSCLELLLHWGCPRSFRDDWEVWGNHRDSLGAVYFLSLQYLNGDIGGSLGGFVGWLPRTPGSRKSIHQCHLVWEYSLAHLCTDQTAAEWTGKGSAPAASAALCQRARTCSPGRKSNVCSHVSQVTSVHGAKERRAARQSLNGADWGGKNQNWRVALGIESAGRG